MDQGDKEFKEFRELQDDSLCGVSLIIPITLIILITPIFKKFLVYKNVENLNKVRYILFEVLNCLFLNQWMVMNLLSSVSADRLTNCFVYSYFYLSSYICFCFKLRGDIPG